MRVVEMIPEKLRPGDAICIVSPSTSLAVIQAGTRQIAGENLSGLGLHITFGRNAEALDQARSSSIEQRLGDLHDAFSDPQIKGLLTSIGGYNCNQLLEYLDYDLIRRHPKILCGFSDITALGNAILAKTGLVTYSGPHYSTFGMRQGLEYTLEYFRKCLMENGPFEVAPSETWSDDAWYRDQEQREFVPNPGYLVINEGQAEGRLVGGNLCTFNLLQGTPFMPSLENTILVVEDDCESQAPHIDRDLQSLLHLPGFEGVRGLVIGRFQKASQIDDETLIEIIRSKRELRRLPVIAHANLGHCTPQMTFPIGGRARLVAEPGQVRFIILDH
jgi:muramoyltetrapeptide carboxypeptidase LdcA involved in peptidoglycan recycling